MTHKKWHTPIKMENYPKMLLHSSNFLSLGSCFASNLKDFFCNAKIRGVINPVGVSFNPMSISKHIQYALNNITLKESSLGIRNGLYFHDDFHSCFNNIDPTICAKNINAAIKKLNLSLLQSNVLILSFGSSIVHTKLSNEQIVANCHKQDSILFKRSFLSTKQIIDALETTLDQIKKKNPALKVILSVSPIRHAKEGFVANNQSKASLLLACKALSENNTQVEYFPAYEIMMDELRDYRFYTDDMLHPNQMAIQHIMHYFLTHFFDSTSQATIRNIQNLCKKISHRPLHPSSPEAIQFSKNLLDEISTVEQEMSFIDFAEEKKIIEERLKV